MQSILLYTSNLDSGFLYMVQSLGPEWKTVAWLLSHGVGSYVIMLTLLFLALVLIEKWRVAIELLTIALISFGVIFLFKLGFHAPRPYMIDPQVVAYETDGGFGLPSAHAAMAVIILGWVALRHPKSKILTWGSIALVILIGLSRVFLGVHYPSQVLAGWILGALLLYIFHAIDQRLWPKFTKDIRKKEARKK
jgi:membrane-associated phospholipid phosphatase